MATHPRPFLGSRCGTAVVTGLPPQPVVVVGLGVLEHQDRRWAHIDGPYCAQSDPPAEWDDESVLDRTLASGLQPEGPSISARPDRHLRLCSGDGAELAAGAFAVRAPWPAARPTLTLLQLLLGPANATLSRLLLLGIFDPADELVAGQGRDVPPCLKCRGVADQRHAHIAWKLVHHPTGNSLAAHMGDGSGTTATGPL